ncbi:unnamed protein product [Protopolystoma xenopodis]|uniref:Uncharacterized protein n=1 Tax=Protopolystoma xenopodis TaxID=117903 RepID=A0A3S5FC97_9PLAT|nr:unnamed protein product [Protopolystoma xenopodis]
MDGDVLMGPGGQMTWVKLPAFDTRLVNTNRSCQQPRAIRPAYVCAYNRVSKSCTSACPCRSLLLLARLGPNSGRQLPCPAPSRPVPSHPAVRARQPLQTGRTLLHPASLVNFTRGQFDFLI